MSLAIGIGGNHGGGVSLRIGPSFFPKFLMPGRGFDDGGSVKPQRPGL